MKSGIAFVGNWMTTFKIISKYVEDIDRMTLLQAYFQTGNYYIKTLKRDQERGCLEFGNTIK